MSYHNLPTQSHGIWGLLLQRPCLPPLTFHSWHPVWMYYHYNHHCPNMQHIASKSPHGCLFLIANFLKSFSTMCAQLCLTLCDPMDWSPPGSSVHVFFPARILECFAISSSRGSSRPRDCIHISYTTGGFFIAESPGKPLTISSFIYVSVFSMWN